MATVTLLPDVVADPGGGQWVNESVTTPTAASVNDNSDSTFWEWASSSVGTVRTDIGTVTVPANSQIRSVAVRNRRALGSTSPHQCRLRIHLYDPVTGALTSTDTYTVSSTAIGTMAGVTHMAAPGGGPWTQAIIDRLQVVVTGDSPTGTGGEYFRLYELYVDVVYNEPPTVAVTAPSGTVTATSQPTITWTYSDPEGDGQERYVAKVFPSTTYLASGFDPETSPPTWNSGEVLSASTSAVIGKALANGVDYRAYVKVADVGSGGRYSAWAYSSLLVQVDVPAVPVVTATADGTNARVSLALQARDNMLSTNTASVDTDATGWANNGNASFARSTAQHLNGTASLAVTAVASGDVSVITSASVACGAGMQVTGLCSFLAGSVSKSVRVELAFLTSADVLISVVPGSTITDLLVGVGWVQASVTAVTPANTAKVKLVATMFGVGIGETHYLDQMSVAPGASTVWTRGGLLPAQYLKVERSTDGTTWDEVRFVSDVVATAVSVPPATQTGTFYDYEAPPGIAVQYRARSNSLDSGNALSGAYSATSTVTMSLTGFWLKDPLDPTRNIPVTVDASQLDTDTTEPQAPHWALNRADPIITAGVVRLDSIPQLTFFFPNDSTWKAFKKLRESGRVLLLQTCYGDAGDEQWYLRLGQTARTSRLTVDTMRTAQPRRVTIDAQAVEAPA